MAGERDLVRGVLRSADRDFGIHRRRRFDVGPQGEYPALRSIGDAVGYIAPGVGDALSTLGEGKGLSTADKAFAASDFAGLPSGGVLAGAAKQVAGRGIRRILDKPVDLGRRRAMRAASERTQDLGRAAAVPALASLVRTQNPTRWGRVPVDARESIALGLKAMRFPVDREVNRLAIGKLLHMGLPNPKVSRRDALKGVVGLTAATAAIPKLSPVGRTLDVVEGARLATPGLKDMRSIRDAAVVRGLMGVGRKLEAPVSRRDVVKGVAGLIAARGAGI